MRYTKQDLVRIIEMLRRLSNDISVAICATESIAESEIFDDECHKVCLQRWTSQKNRYLRLNSSIISRGYSIAPPVQECIKKVDELFRRGTPDKASTYKAINAHIRALLEMLDYEATLDLDYK